MNGKLVAAFISGAVLASGIVYLAIRPPASTRPGPTADVRAVDVPPQPPDPPNTSPQVRETPPALETPAPQPAAKPAIVPTPKPASQHQRLAQIPIREKPSPMPAPARHPEPTVVARNDDPKIEVSVVRPPQQPAAPEPAPAPPAPAAQTPAPQTPAASAPPPPPAPEPVSVPPLTATQSSSPAPDERQPHSVVLAAGTRLTVRIGETISAAHNRIGDTFVATLEQPLVIDGFIICERGSRVVGKVTQATPAGTAGGQSHLGIELTRLNTSDRQRVEVRTDTYSRDGSGSVGSDLAKIGAGTAIGAAIGAIAGGGKGAAIGAGAGAAAGTGVVLVSNARSVEIPVEARVTFRIKESITLTEKLD